MVPVVLWQSVEMLSCIVLSVINQNVTYNPFILSVVRLSVVMVNVIMQSVMVLFWQI